MFLRRRNDGKVLMSISTITITVYVLAELMSDTALSLSLSLSLSVCACVCGGGDMFILRCHRESEIVNRTSKYNFYMIHEGNKSGIATVHAETSNASLVELFFYPIIT